MEPISAIIDGFRNQKNTVAPTNIKPKLNKLGKSRGDLLQDLCLSEPLCTFGNFKSLPGTEQAYRAMKDIATGKGSTVMLLCYGSSGCGKTHLLKAAVLRLYGRGIFVRYLTWTWVINALKNGLNTGAIPGYRQIIYNYCYANALVLDDIGMGTTWTDWESGQFEEIIDIRYDRHLLTIMATNKQLDELPDRVISRLRDSNVGLIILNTGSDYRRRVDLR